MKKIGIITYHNALNLGAVLQTYALNSYINKLGYDCETINYQCKKIVDSYKIFDISNYKSIIKSFINMTGNIKKRKKFSKFLNNNVVLSKETYDNNNISNANSKYNFFIVGSDQVWNYGLNNDDNFFLKFVDSGNKKMSYAASFGNNEIIEIYKDKIRTYLNSFDLISVREYSAKKKLKEIANIESSFVLDPTFLLSQKEWNKITLPNCKKPKKFILAYLLHEKDVFGIAKKMKKITGYDLYIITNSFVFGEKRINNAGIENFLSLIKNSEYVITDSFHGTALSIIYRKNLKVVLKNTYKHLNDRLISILDLFQLSECIVDNYTTDDKLISKTNYSKSEKIIEDEIAKSKMVLFNIINKEGEKNEIM